MNTFASHAFGDASLLPELGKDLNVDIAANWWHYKKLLEYPNARFVGGARSVNLKEGEDFKILDLFIVLPQLSKSGFVFILC